MRLVIYRTYSNSIIATAETTVNTPQEYIAYLAKFNVEIDMQDALSDILAGEEVTLSLPLEMDYSLSAYN